jgi:hypothetical protein
VTSAGLGLGLGLGEGGAGVGSPPMNIEVPLIFTLFNFIFVYDILVTVKVPGDLKVNVYNHLRWFILKLPGYIPWMFICLFH